MNESSVLYLIGKCVAIVGGFYIVSRFAHLYLDRKFHGRK